VFFQSFTGINCQRALFYDRNAQIKFNGSLLFVVSVLVTMVLAIGIGYAWVLPDL
jgi:hypothetical protein